MLEIGDCKQKPVVENRAGNVERNPGLAYICSSLEFIPLEVKLPIMQGLLSRGEQARERRLNEN